MKANLSPAIGFLSPTTLLPTSSKRPLGHASVRRLDVAMISSSRHRRQYNFHAARKDIDLLQRPASPTAPNATPAAAELAARKAAYNAAQQELRRVQEAARQAAYADARKVADEAAANAQSPVWTTPYSLQPNSPNYPSSSSSSSSLVQPDRIHNPNATTPTTTLTPPVPREPQPLAVGTSRPTNPIGSPTTLDRVTLHPESSALGIPSKSSAVEVAGDSHPTQEPQESSRSGRPQTAVGTTVDLLPATPTVPSPHREFSETTAVIAYAKAKESTASAAVAPADPSAPQKETHASDPGSFSPHPTTDDQRPINSAGNDVGINVVESFVDPAVSVNETTAESTLMTETSPVSSSSSNTNDSLADVMAVLDLDTQSRSQEISKAKPKAKSTKKSAGFQPSAASIGASILDAIVEGVGVPGPTPAKSKSSPKTGIKKSPTPELVDLVDSGKIKSLTVTKLRRLLSDNELKTTGRKSELVARLTSFAKSS